MTWETQYFHPKHNSSNTIIWDPLDIPLMLSLKIIILMEVSLRMDWSNGVIMARPLPKLGEDHLRAHGAMANFKWRMYFKSKLMIRSSGMKVRIIRNGLFLVVNTHALEIWIECLPNGKEEALSIAFKSLH